MDGQSLDPVVGAACAERQGGPNASGLKGCSRGGNLAERPSALAQREHAVAAADDRRGVPVHPLRSPVLDLLRAKQATSYDEDLAVYRGARHEIQGPVRDGHRAGDPAGYSERSAVERELPLEPTARRQGDVALHPGSRRVVIERDQVRNHIRRRAAAHE
jgi:hypothetical protein